MTGNIYLTGFMGAGKTTVGRVLARVLSRRFVDMDKRLSMGFGLPLVEVFARHGEAAFREAETALLAKLAGRDRLVVATGGGLPIDPRNRQSMRSSGRIVHLAAGLETCRQRMTGRESAVRPLWPDDAGTARLFEARQKAYADCDLTAEVDGFLPEGAAAMILDGLMPESRFTVKLGHDECPVIATMRAERVVAEMVQKRRVVLLSERRVARLHLDRWRAALDRPFEIVVAPGERSKSLATARRIYRALLEARIERGDLMVAVGGGMVTDLGAFVAATYKRGMDFILAPTTLLACVDAAVGGKAAVNLGPAKNMVGCFTAPEGVALDLMALSTLPKIQIAEGLVEAYKTGLACEPSLMKLVEERLDDLLGGDLEAMSLVAVSSARAKAGVVESDFQERGRRAILNLGHTFGHVVEGYYNFRVSHGRAVALGLMVAARLSLARGLIKDGLVRRIDRTLAPLKAGEIKLPPVKEAWELMQDDKKNKAGRVSFVLIEGPGRTRIVDDVTIDELAAALRRLEMD